MRRAILLLFIVPSAAHARWFGPDTEEECIEAYATKAADDRLVRLAIRACGYAFDQRFSAPYRDKWFCIAESIPDLKTGIAGQAAIMVCESKHPADEICAEGFEAMDGASCAPVCAEGEFRDPFRGNRCVSPHADPA